MNFSVLVVFGFLVANAAVNANDSVPPTQLVEAWKLKQLTKTLESTGLTNLFTKHMVSPRTSETDISFYYYSFTDQSGEQITVADQKNQLKSANFNATNPSVFIVHGWHNTYTSSIVTEIKTAVFSKTKNINVFAVNWDEYAAKDYFSAIGNVPNFGKYFGEFLNSMSTNFNQPLSKITLIGHSLGAHICGFAGKETNGTVGVIVGLDPAGPFYFENNPESRLASTDAQYVHAIHTNAEFLGVNYALGNSDFWPNGGLKQPECGEDLLGTCSHGLSYAYFAESISDNDFLGVQCADYDTFTKGECSGEIGPMGGFSIDTSSSGSYFLKTNLTSPYGLGSAGINA